MTWLRKNRWGLMLLVPSLALALFASSFRLVNLYLPWSSDRAIAATRSVEISSDLTLVTYPDESAYTATLTPIDVKPVASGGDEYIQYEAAPNATLWRLSTNVNADPEMVLSECSITLEGESGTVYGASAGKVSDGEPYVDTWGDLCVPMDTPGPSTDLDNSYVPADPDSERPRSYRLETYFALPTEEQPQTVRVALAREPHWELPAPLR